MKELLKIEVPLFVTLKNGRKWYLNLNNFQRTNRFTLSYAKHSFYSIIKDIMAKQDIFIDVAARVRLTVYPQTKRLFDLDNSVVIAKFVFDALQEFEYLSNDHYEIITNMELTFGSVDKVNPRCEVLFYQINNEEIKDAYMF